ncbi:MAG: tol-pal system-associated acyl-CoA thioesterase [Pseudomonadota bacterium]
MSPHRFAVRVYYEDTDLAGIVYYANYLRYIERARTEFVRELGIDQSKLRDQEGIVFAVRRIEADYLTPARFDDQLVITTELVTLSGARLVLSQKVATQETECFEARVTLAAMRLTGRPARLPQAMRDGLEALRG